MFTPAFRRFVWAGCALFAAAGTPACTLFGAVGEGMVEGGGTLAAKTRDEHPGPQRFDIAVPSKGYAYLGLFTGDKHRFNMGFNEKGLFLARSTSGSLLRKERLALPRFFKHRLSATDWTLPADRPLFIFAQSTGLILYPTSLSSTRLACCASTRFISISRACFMEFFTAFFVISLNVILL